MMVSTDTSLSVDKNGRTKAVVEDLYVRVGFGRQLTVEDRFRLDLLLRGLRFFFFFLGCGNGGNG